ncbi:MAG: hypothetical protein VYE05_00480, partial [Bacteroidota bacterium]|nr:hypothetical protein [Bacteroidota bacterium]
SLGDYDKANEILDLSFEKLPIEYFGYYSLSEPYINSYYKIEKIEKARDLFKVIEEKYHDQINYYSKSILYNENNFDLESYAENIFTYNERLRGLLENQINLGEIEFVSDYLLKYMETSNVFKSLYGEYDFFNYLISFISPLYLAEKISEARNLYEINKRLISERLKNLISAMDDSSADYINSLSKQELGNYEELIAIISEHEDEEYIKSEINEYLIYVDDLSL